MRGILTRSLIFYITNLIALAKLQSLAEEKFQSAKSLFITVQYTKYALADITTIRITKSTHKKIMGQIQARTGKIPTLDDALQEMLSNYKKKSRK